MAIAKTALCFDYKHKADDVCYFFKYGNHWLFIFMEDEIMLLSIALILMSGIILGAICTKLKLPSLIGMIFAGILLSPYAFNLIDDSTLLVAGDIRQIALVIILTKAGLSLALNDLKKVGRPAILMCFVPACFEIIAFVIFAPMLLNISIVDSLLMGSVLAAVSPAVIVPRMIKIMDEGYGKKHSVPQLILAGASLDDIFVIVLFTSFLSLAQNDNFTFISLLQIPISIVLGIILGIIIGSCLCYLFKIIQIRNSIKVLLLLSISFLLIELQNQLTGLISISGLIAIMSIGFTIHQKDANQAKSLSFTYNQLWIVAEIMLFVLVGVTINTKYIMQAGFLAIVLIVIALVIRVFGVSVCLMRSPLTKKERLFCMGAYTPKATVQAAIATIPLSVGLPCGEIILTVAVLAIVLTAPLGSFFIEKTYKKLLV